LDYFWEKFQLKVLLNQNDCFSGFLETSLPENKMKSKRFLDSFWKLFQQKVI
jgi:hypothetical protein